MNGADWIRLMDTYTAAHLFVAVLYFILFLSIIRVMVRKSIKSLFPLAVASLFLLLTVVFFLKALPSPSFQPEMKFAGFAAACIPAILFLSFRRRASALDLEETLGSLERFDRLKEDFLSMASHELRTPLSVISGFAEILVREKIGPLNDEQKRRIRKIWMQGQRLNRIVDELLDLSRIRSGKVAVRREVFDLVPVLKACLDDHLIVAEQQRIKLLDHIPDILPDVAGDLERVTQVVVNLLNNSIKYTEPGGTVTLSAGHDPMKNEVRIEVHDTGIGIDLKDQDHVFEEFYRSSHQYARKFSGSGLGLAIVKQLVEAQGGRVWLNSEGIGKGASFFFTLPEASLDKDSKGRPLIRNYSRQ